jgi:hypothetical protein
MSKEDSDPASFTRNLVPSGFAIRAPLYSVNTALAPESLCKQMIEETTDIADVCVAYNPSWPHGLVGIMAARAVEHFGVPGFALGLDPSTHLAFGSARSVPGFDLVAAMRACSSLLMKVWRPHRCSRGDPEAGAHL